MALSVFGDPFRFKDRREGFLSAKLPRELFLPPDQVLLVLLTVDSIDNKQENGKLLAMESRQKLECFSLTPHDTSLALSPLEVCMTCRSALSHCFLTSCQDCCLERSQRCSRASRRWPRNLRFECLCQHLACIELYEAHFHETSEILELVHRAFRSLIDSISYCQREQEASRGLISILLPALSQTCMSLGYAQILPLTMRSKNARSPSFLQLHALFPGPGDQLELAALGWLLALVVPH